MAKRRSRNSRRRRAGNNTNGNTGGRTLNPGTPGGLALPRGEQRQFGVSLKQEIRVSKAFTVDDSSFVQFERELQGIAEFRVLSYTLNWEPLVTPNSASNVMVGVVGYATEELMKLAGSELDDLLRAGMQLHPASSRKRITVQVPVANVTWYNFDETGPGFYVYVAGAAGSTTPVGRVTGTVNIQVRGVRGSAPIS